MKNDEYISLFLNKNKLKSQSQHPDYKINGLKIKEIGFGYKNKSKTNENYILIKIKVSKLSEELS